MRIYFNQQSAQYSVYYLGWNLIRHLRLLLPKSDHRILLCCSSAIIIIIQQLAHCKWRSADSKWIQQGSPHCYHFCICYLSICFTQILTERLLQMRIYFTAAQYSLSYGLSWQHQSEFSRDCSFFCISSHTSPSSHLRKKTSFRPFLFSKTLKNFVFRVAEVGRLLGSAK